MIKSVTLLMKITKKLYVKLNKWDIVVEIVDKDIVAIEKMIIKLR